jgi:hypothetical protein
MDNVYIISSRSFKSSLLKRYIGQGGEFSPYRVIIGGCIPGYRCSSRLPCSVRLIARISSTLIFFGFCFLTRVFPLWLPVRLDPGRLDPGRLEPGLSGSDNTGTSDGELKCDDIGECKLMLGNCKLRRRYGWSGTSVLMSKSLLGVCK